MKQMSQVLLLFFVTACITIHGQNARGPVLLIIATRPDGIKMAPVYHALKNLNIPTLLCSTDQHTNLLQDVIEIFETTPDFSLNIMKPGQDLFHITARALEELKNVYRQAQPSLVIVQGDTTSAMTAALAAFYLKIPVGHVEAGLRTYNIYGPFPEEINRQIISLIAQYHFAPTQLAANKLLAEGIDSRNIFTTGNTVVDALHSIQNKITSGQLTPSQTIVNAVAVAREKESKICLLTAHRRESFGRGLQSIFTAIKKALMLYPDLYVIYPVHPNPAIKEALQEVKLDTMNNIAIMPALSYIDMVYLLHHADIVATDSGGIQEETISLNKQVCVLRKETERMEGVDAGLAFLVGDDEEKIVQTIDYMMHTKRYKASTTNIYGDGTAGQQIAAIIKEKFGY